MNCKWEVYDNYEKYYYCTRFDESYKDSCINNESCFQYEDE